MKLFYRNAGTGKPLIILHGLFGSSDNWNTLQKFFAQHYNVYTVDLRNHGQSPHSDVWNYEVMAQDVIDLIDDKKLQNISVIGHSMGGKVAIELASEISENLENLIVVDISVKYYPPHHQKIFQALHAVNPSDCSNRKEAEDRIRIVLNDEPTIQFLLKNLYWKNDELAWRMNLPVIEKNILEVGKESTKVDLNKQLKFTTHFIRGGNSDYIKPEEFNLIYNHFPHAQIHTIEGAGHWVQAEKPKEFAELVISILK